MQYINKYPSLKQVANSPLAKTLLSRYAKEQADQESDKQHSKVKPKKKF